MVIDILKWLHHAGGHPVFINSQNSNRKFFFFLLVQLSRIFRGGSNQRGTKARERGLREGLELERVGIFFSLLRFILENGGDYLARSVLYNKFLPPTARYSRLQQSIRN